MEYLRSWWSNAQSDGNGTAAEPSKKGDRLSKKLGLSTGSAHSKDGTVKAGWATLRGKRQSNEDTLYCQFHSSPRLGEVACLGVFDGHGGAKASAFVRDHVFENLLNHQQFENNNLFKAVEEAYLETDHQYIDLDEAALQDDGCCALTAVVADRRLIVAHVGDSRAVLCIGGQAVQLTEDHKPDRQDERSRIEDAGGMVLWAGTWRVSGVLAVSRSFGNRQMKQFIIPHPEIREDKLTPAHSCLVMASDGLWDVMDNQEAVQLVGRYDGAEQAARGLAMEAYTRGSADNITCVVAIFKLGKADAGFF